MRPWPAGLLVLVLGFTPAVPARSAEANERTQALRVFLDCDGDCDFEFLRQQVVYVNYVRDRFDAQVHVLVNRQRAASGNELTLNFIGLEDFEGIDLSLVFSTSDTDTEFEERETFARYFEIGLVRYVLETPMVSRLKVSFEPSQEGRSEGTRPEDDGWNFWVFRLRANGSVESEQQRDSQNYSASVNASRTTEKWRLGLGINSNYSERNFQFDDGTELKDVTRSAGFGTQVVKTLTDHWGLGVGASSRRSTFLNLDFSYRTAAALQYNLFPYSESSERELTFAYFLGATRFNYEEETLFGKLNETLADQGFFVSFDTRQPWGESGVDLEFAHFLDDFAKRRLEVQGDIEYRVVRGLSVDIFARASWIMDQIFLPRRSATDEEVLLARRALATDFRFRVGVGLRYTFGSIYNNIVNSRLTGRSRGFHSIF